ncbi:MAG: hypothetical protein KAY55_00360 [Deltaproteobacteria bacterium]|jgi:hypothetical protein|nr:hypothetical protein [Deltaproteobacteria bacterium]
MHKALAMLAAGYLAVVGGVVQAQEGELPPAPYDFRTIECGELDNDAGYRPLRPSHVAGEDTDILCKVTVALSDKTKGSAKPHTVKLTVSHGTKVTYEQVRDARVLSVGSRVLLFVIPAEKLPTEPGKVSIRAELSKPVNKPGFQEVTYTLSSED